MINRVGPKTLVRVLNLPAGSLCRVIRAELSNKKEFLNTYTRGGNIIKARGAACPVRLDNIKETEL